LGFFFIVVNDGLAQIFLILVPQISHNQGFKVVRIAFLELENKFFGSF
jgi:hypothetical protein